jgi:hypothetical protein
MLETGGGQNVWKSSYLRGSKCLKLDNLIDRANNARDNPAILLQLFEEAQNRELNYIPFSTVQELPYNDTLNSAVIVGEPLNSVSLNTVGEDTTISFCTIL